MNPVASLPVSPTPTGSLPLLYVEERDGRISSFVFRGEVKHVDRVLKMWASGTFSSGWTEETSYYTIMSDDQMIATVARDNVHRHWYLVRLMD
ncbi:MAG: hypothetical protein Q7V53_01135 [Caldisericota bacterium]|jgi:hypothetical protein|nr:hypothetical protein [Caldisericota bacterium]